MKKFVTFMILLCTVTFGAYAQRFAFIDMEYISQNIPEYQTATDQLQKLSEQWQSEIEKVSNEAKTLYENYQKTTGLSDAVKRQREDAIVAKEKEAVELRQKYFGQEGEMMKKQQELLEPLQDEIYQAVKSIAQRKGYAAVIDRASASSIIFAQPSIDISEEVLQELGIEIK